ncbi:hypothetical protein [Nocardia sp. NPDC024068]|uniref:hypothetical protein n=1 Tax=Nocardia sp. NPDC024068 TaxID=3157197 RepID=UPI00340B584E
MVGLPSFGEIVVGLGELAMKGPLGAMVRGSADIDAAAQALAAANGDQSPEAIAARSRIQDLTDNQFDGEFHHARIPEGLFENVRGADVDELYRKAQSIDVAAMDTLFQMWNSRAQKLETGLAEFGPAIRAAMAESWTGASASAAATGITDYVAKAHNLVSASKIVADKVGLVKSAVEVTKQNVQPAPDTGWASTVAGWVPGPSWKMDSDRTSAAELATYSVLEKVYQPGIREGDTAQPRIPLAYNPIHDPGTTTGPGPAGTQTGQPNGSTDTGGPQPGAAPATDNPETGDPGANEPQAAAETPASTENPASTTTPAGLDTTTASSTPSPGTTVPNTPGTPSTTPGSPSTTPGAPVGSTPGSPGAPLPGQTVPGPGTGTGPGRPGAATAATAAGQSRGTPGMGPMMPGGARGRGDDDKEKQKSDIAEALVTQEHGDELTGLDPEHRPKTVPPVLGE